MKKSTGMNWNSSSVEEWKGSEEVQIDLAKENSMIITILERKSVGLEEYGDYDRPKKKRREVQGEQGEKEKDVEMVQEEEQKPEETKKKTVEEMEEENRQAMNGLFPEEPPDVDEGKVKEAEEKLPKLGEKEEAMMVAGEEITPYSTLKKMRTVSQGRKNRE